MDQVKLYNSSNEDPDSSAPTIGQLERKLSQKIGALYREQLGHQIGKVTCQLLDTKLTIIIEDSVTKPEKLLADDGQKDLAEKVREDLEKAVENQLKDLIQNILNVGVIDCLSDSSVETERSGLIVILDEAPQARSKRNKQS